ncbi:MAG TPA: hypothetical protein VIM48_07400 [Chthoniobacterales bacterium]
MNPLDLILVGASLAIALTLVWLATRRKKQGCCSSGETSVGLAKPGPCAGCGVALGRAAKRDGQR